MDQLKTAAVLWWQSKRPVAWSEEDHMQNPTINCVTEEEKRLATEIARIIEQQGGE